MSLIQYATPKPIKWHYLKKILCVGPTLPNIPNTLAPKIYHYYNIIV